MRKQILSFLLTLIFSFTMVVPGFAADVAIPVADKVTAMEKLLYGTGQSGSLIQRMDSLEDDVYGTVTSDTILKRIDNLYDYLQSSEGNDASFATRLNAVEWRFCETMTNAPAKTRIENAEKLVNGGASSGALSVRLDELLKLAAYENGSLPVQKVTLPKDTVLKIEFTEEMSTRNSRIGDQVNFKVGDNYYMNEVLVIPKGAMGVGHISKVVQPGMFGKDGRIDIKFSHVVAIDGTNVNVMVGELAKQQATSIAGAAGATIGGMVLLGPIGVVGGAFVKGKAVTIPVGATTYVQTAEAVEMQGVVCEAAE